ncbi:hypothetical protein OIU79_008278 [Salix purpurea]|uniref:BLOC-1-related complex subunit 7 n=3 Tax=Salix TaxID=40685 RepID=A0A9Q0TI78_SALPP|nr:hypothetical protein OIU79_008278 [Salix purpurea]
MQMERAMERPASSGGNASAREGMAKTVVADQISQAVQSTSNLLHLMQQSSPSQAKLMKLPKNLLAKASTIKNTGQVLDQMPKLISSLDAHMDSGLQRLSTCILLVHYIHPYLYKNSRFHSYINLQCLIVHCIFNFFYMCH